MLPRYLNRMLLVSLLGAALTAQLALALGEQRVIYFPSDHASSLETEPAQSVFSVKHHENAFTIASKSDNYVAPFLLDSEDNIAIHLAARTLARDIYTITGIEPRLYNDTLPSNISHAIIVGSVGSELVKSIKDGREERQAIEDNWESYDVRVSKTPLKHLDTGLVITGSDRVSCFLSTSLNRSDVSAEQYTQSTPCPSRWESRHSTTGPTSPSVRTRT